MSALSKYLLKVKQVLRSQLNGQNNIQAINTHALTIIRYLAGLIIWPKEEIDATDINTRTLLIMHGGFQPKSSTLKLYTK